MKMAQNKPQKSTKFCNLAVGVPGMVLGGPECIWRKFRCFLKNSQKKFSTLGTIGVPQRGIFGNGSPKIAKFSQKLPPKKRKNHESGCRGVRNGAGGVQNVFGESLDIF